MTGNQPGTIAELKQQIRRHSREGAPAMRVEGRGRRRMPLHPSRGHFDARPSNRAPALATGHRSQV